MQTFTDEELTSEEWRPCISYPGYWASSLGRIRSFRQSFELGRLLKPTLYASCGYWYVSVCFAGKKRHKNKRIHALVLDAWEGPRPEGAHGRHFPDRDTSNNRRENLSWSTAEQNMQDKHVHGTMPVGERNPSARLSDAQVAEIIASPRTGVDLAREHGLAPETVWRWRRGVARGRRKVA